MLKGVRPVAIVPWQEVMSESEVFVLRQFYAIRNADCWRAAFLIVFLTMFFMLCSLFVG